MSKNNVRIAIRDSTDSHNVAFFDNKAGIKYKSANLHRFLAGSASILTIKYNSKDIDTIRSGCKLAFRYKNRDYWLNVMSFEKKGFEVELAAYSLGLELNNETRGEHKPENAMSIAEYVAYYDPEHALTIGVNEVSDKRIKLEWTGTDTILARLFSVANSFGAELDFSVELNDDYSLKRQVLNIYKKGNLGTNKVSQPVRVGKELKVINYSDNIKELRTAVRATGKDGLTIDGLNKKIYDSNKQLLYYSSGMTVYAPQSRDRFPSVGKGSNDNWIVEDLGETQYETKEALWGYMYGEIQKKSVPEITYEVEGAIEAGIGDTQTLIDDIHFDPALYVQARVSELEDDILTGKVTKSTFINFERKYSQIADILLKQVEALAEDTATQISSLSSEFKQTTGSIKASVQSLDNNTVKSSSLTINTDGVVIKAGKSTSDFANAVGSYFAVNQNAINSFSDKINVKGNMIVDGAITGDKIKANSVDVSKIVGIDADYIKAKIEYAMIDWLKGKTITAYNDNMTIDLQDGRISFKDGSNAVYRQTPDGIHTGFLHFEAGSQGGIYAAFGATSTRQGINSKSSEFAGIRCYRVSKDGDSHDAKIDKIEVVGDTVQFGHGYRSDGSIGGGFIMDTAAYANETPYSLNRVVKSIESLWRILHDHAKNTGYRFNDPAFISALNNEYNAWHDMHND